MRHFLLNLRNKQLLMVSQGRHCFTVEYEYLGSRCTLVSSQTMDSWSCWSRAFSTLGSRSRFCLFLASVSDAHLSFQNHTLVTGGEDGKINSWPIHPVELDAEELINGDDADGDELMDVDMPSPKGRKRERDGDNELVGFFFYCLIIFDIICFTARQTSQTLTCHGVLI